jgi:tRNA(Ile)-lysidine synthase
MTPAAPDDHSQRLLADVARTIERHAMLANGARILVAVSGGSDSVGLLHLLHALAPRWNLTLEVAHLDHGLRGEAGAADARFVAELARQSGLACHTGRADAAALQRSRRLSPEDAARRVRYAFLTRTARRCGALRVALGHTADDNAESILMRLLQGCGPQGMAGMAPVRSGRFIRPLLETDRQEVIAYLTRHRFSWVEDATNRDLHFLRNRIRHVLLPLLTRDFTPAAARLLNRTAAIVRDEESWLSELVASDFESVVLERGPEMLALSRAALRARAPALQRRLIRHAFFVLQMAGARQEFKHVEALRSMVAAADAPEWQRHLPGRIVAKSAGDRLVLQRVSARSDGRPAIAALPPAFEPPLALPGPGRYRVAAEGAWLQVEAIEAASAQHLLGAGQLQALFDMDTIRFPLILRHCRPGDRFQPLGAPGTQGVSQYFSDHHVPRALRDRGRVLLSQDRIIWLVGHRIDARVKLRPETRIALRVRWQPDAPPAPDPGAQRPVPQGGQFIVHT